MKALPAAVHSGFNYQGQDQELGSYQIASLNIDYTDSRFNQTAGLTGSLSSGVTFEAHGEWLYVDSSSVAAPVATFYTDGDDSRTVALVPGRVIRTRFDRVRVFSTNGQTAALAASTITINPACRLFYGMGDCPFNDSFVIGSTEPIPYSSSQFNTAPASQTPATFHTSAIALPQGATIKICSEATQTVSVANNTSILRPSLAINFIDNSVQAEYPNTFYSTDAVGATTVGQVARGWATWEFTRLPKAMKSIQVFWDNFGTEATNNIQLPVCFMLLG